MFVYLFDYHPRPAYYKATYRRINSTRVIQEPVWSLIWGYFARLVDDTFLSPYL